MDPLTIILCSIFFLFGIQVSIIFVLHRLSTERDRQDSLHKEQR